MFRYIPLLVKIALLRTIYIKTFLCLWERNVESFRMWNSQASFVTMVCWEFYVWEILNQQRNHVGESVRFEVLTAVKITMLFFWVVTPCGLISRYQSF
jgi:hypothetical protein